MPDFEPNSCKPLGVGLTPRLAWWFLGVAVLWVAVNVLTSSITSPVDFVHQTQLIAYDLGLRDAPPEGVDLAQWPAWRDLRTTTIALVMALTVVLAAYQWRGYSRVMSSMTGNGALTVRTIADRTKLAQEIRATNKWIRGSRHARVPVLLFSAVAATLVYIAQRFFFIGDGADQVWWITAITPNMPIYLAVGMIGIYIVTMQNIVGFRIIGAFWRIQRRKIAHFGADLLNEDGVWGWAAARLILGVTYAEIVIHGIGLLAAVLSVPATTIALLVIAIPSIEWAATMIVYLTVPAFLITRGIRRFKAAQFAGTTDADRGNIRFDARVAARVDRVNAVPPLPFIKLWSGVFYIVGNLANIFSLIGLLAVFRNEDTWPF